MARLLGCTAACARRLNPAAWSRCIASLPTRPRRRPSHLPAGATQMPIPFTCPMDHVLDLAAFDDEASEVKITFREHSFYDNPRMPHATRASKLTIYVHEVRMPSLPSASLTSASGACAIAAGPAGNGGAAPSAAARCGAQAGADVPAARRQPRRPQLVALPAFVPRTQVIPLLRLEYVIAEGGPVLHLPAHLPHGQLVDLLEPHQNFTILHFRQPSMSLLKLADDKLQEMLDKRVERLKQSLE
jgi:hypothetical protein